jgi:hypothetical protein
MGFLDDLKRQADALQAQQHTDVAALERNARLADAACKGAFTYLDTLTRQLLVLKPVSKVRYELDKKTRFEGLPITTLKVDARRKMLRGTEVFDHVALHARLTDGRKLQLVKDFLPDIEKLESRLRQSGATVHSQAVRNPDNGKLLEMRYEFVVDFVLGLRMTPDHDRGRIAVRLMNFDGFETVELELPAIELGAARLDELARWLLGEPHRFLDGAQALRRIEA